MAIAVYVLKRKLRAKLRNGQAKRQLVLRWKDPTTGKWQYESTGCADRTQARALQRIKFDQLNGIAPPAEDSVEPEPEPALPTWAACRAALEREMRTNNMRATSIADYMLMLDSLATMFPDIESPALITLEHAREYKRRRAEGDKERGIAPLSPWTVKGDLSTLKAIFGKWLCDECGLLKSNPFAKVKAPKCEDPEVRIVSAEESAELFAWLDERWNDWKLPRVYLEVATLLGWRATELASMRTDNVLADGFVRVSAESSKTRKPKIGWLPAKLHDELKDCAAGGWAFGRFSDELRRLLLLWKRAPHHAAKVGDYTPARLVGWLQDELKRFNALKAKALAEAIPAGEWQPFTLHDFRRTAITEYQMAGVSREHTGTMVGCTDDVMRKHYEKLNQMAIARRNVERRLSG